MGVFRETGLKSKVALARFRFPRPILFASKAGRREGRRGLIPGAEIQPHAVLFDFVLKFGRGRGKDEDGADDEVKMRGRMGCRGFKRDEGGFR
jgi:hypothetical protein